MEANKINHKDEVVPGVTLKELIAIKDEFREGKREGEFTISEFGELTDISYERSKKVLRKALSAGRVELRKVGARCYYRIKDKE